MGVEETLEEKRGSWGGIGSNGFGILLWSGVETV
jgi:hypothetical protein